MSETTEQLLTAPNEAAGFSFKEKIVMMIIVWAEILSCLLAVIMNPLTIVAIFSFKLIKKSVTNLFILSLCISDFLFGASYLFVKVIHLLQLHGYEDNDIFRVLSWVSSAMTDYCYFQGLMKVIIIGLDRVLATAKPLSHRGLVTFKRGLVVVLFAWTCNWFITFPAVVIMATRFNSLSQIPVLHHPVGVLPPEYVKGFTTPYIGFCYIFCSVIYGLVIIFYFRAKKRINVNSDSSKQKARRMTRMVIAIVGLLLITNIPHLVMATIFSTVVTDQSLFLTVYEAMYLLGIIGVSINNFMYAWHIDYYRVAYMKLLNCYNPELHDGGTSTDTGGDKGPTTSSKVTQP